MHVLRMIDIYIYIPGPNPKWKQVLHNFSQQRSANNQSPGLWWFFGLHWLLAPKGFRQGRIWQPQKRLPMVILKRNTSKSGDASRKGLRLLLCGVTTFKTNTWITPVLGARIRHGHSQSWELWAMCIQNVHHLQDSIERFQWLIPIIKLKIKQWTMELRKHVFFVKPVASQTELDSDPQGHGCHIPSFSTLGASVACRVDLETEMFRVKTLCKLNNPCKLSAK